MNQRGDAAREQAESGKNAMVDNESEKTAAVRGECAGIDNNETECRRAGALNPRTKTNQTQKPGRHTC